MQWAGFGTIQRFDLYSWHVSYNLWIFFDKDLAISESGDVETLL